MGRSGLWGGINLPTSVVNSWTSPLKEGEEMYVSKVYSNRGLAARSWVQEPNLGTKGPGFLDNRNQRKDTDSYGI